MSSKDYYNYWLEQKKKFYRNLEEDRTLQEIAVRKIGIKPQSAAINLVARIYCRYCEVYNKLCDCYDQMAQVQRRPYIKKLIDSLTCRIMEIKLTLQNVEAFEYTYTDNALQQLLITPDDVEILCPYFYPFEIREQEMQYVMDEIMSGNRIGDPTPSPSELERREEERLLEEQRIQEEKEAEIKRKMALGIDIVESEPEIVYSPAELEERRKQALYEKSVNDIQRMERARVVIREKTKKINKDADVYLELAGTKAPAPNPEIRDKATALIQETYRIFMQIKRMQLKEKKLRTKIEMIIPSWRPPSHKIQLEKVKETRRKFRQNYYQEWLKASMKEKSKVLRLRKDDMFDDISSEVRQWFLDWYNDIRNFDEYPWPGEGGSILIVTGQTFNFEEYLVWKKAEEKRLKAEKDNPKTKKELAMERKMEREAQKLLDKEAKEREKKVYLDYKKSRLKPENDPGVYIDIGHQIDNLFNSWKFYECQWRDIDTPLAELDVIKGFLEVLVTETAYQDVHLEVRPVVDESMRLELALLKAALKKDYDEAGVPPNLYPLVPKRKKPRVRKPQKPPKIPASRIFQDLYDNGIIKSYPKLNFSEFVGDRNYAAADARAVLWTPWFPPPCIGDVREQVKIKCLLALGSNCQNVERTHLLVGPKGSGKRTLAYAIANETNSLLMDLSPFNVYNKYPGPKNLKKMFANINRISRNMQPTIILISDVDKIFYKKVPPEEKEFDPTRLQKDLFKEIIKPIKTDDKILVIATASEPWLSKPLMLKCFQSIILLPKSDYGSLYYVLLKELMKFHGVDRDINIDSVAQVAKGFDINSIRKALESLMSGERQVKLYSSPLKSEEILNSILSNENSKFTDDFDYEMFMAWYLKVSPWGENYEEYMRMLDSQLQFKLKAEKKKKKP